MDLDLNYLNTLFKNKNSNGNNKKPDSGASNNNKKRKPKNVNDGQWEQWQVHDQEFVAGCFEKDLEEAILQSKLQYEAEEVSRKFDDKQRVTLDKKKKKKAQPMNLEEFNQKLDEAAAVGSSRKSVGQDKDGTSTEDFFKSVGDATKSTLWKEIRGPSGQFTSPLFEQKHREVTSSESSSSSANSEELESLKLENVTLKSEVEDLKEKLKRAANLIKNAQMKEKVELLREIQNLRKTQSTMSEEMSTLYIELEQEKSRASTSGSSRSTMKKNVRFDASSEVSKN